MQPTETYGVKEEAMNEARAREERSRGELLELVAIAVDCAKGEAHVNGDKHYVEFCDEVLFPFLESEMDRESRHGGEVHEL
jgi:hypothetical protein